MKHLIIRMNAMKRYDHRDLVNRDSEMSILLNSCEEYMLTPEVAQGIINEVVTAVKGWRVLANKLGIFKREMDLFISFSNSFTSFCSSKPSLRTSTCLFFISLLSSYII